MPVRSGARERKKRKPKGLKSLLGKRRTKLSSTSDKSVDSSSLEY